MTATGEYGIAANVCEIDKVLRMGAKCWLIGGDRGGGFERLEVLGASRSAWQIEKYTPIHRLTNFRVKWLPDHLRPRVIWWVGTKEEMEQQAAMLQAKADGERVAHPNREYQI